MAANQVGKNEENREEQKKTSTYALKKTLFTGDILETRHLVKKLSRFTIHVFFAIALNIITMTQ